MSSTVSIMEVAKAAGVSKTTVSRVLNGKLDRFRIGRDAQERVRAVARQMGYQPDPIARNVALGKGAPPRPPRVTAPELQSQVPTGVAVRREIGLILSVNSPTESLVLLPGLEPSLAVAGYRLVVITVSADPAVARQRLVQFLGDGLSGILCCPSVYQATLATVAGKCPVVVLWAGAGKAMVATLAAPQQPPAASIGTPPPVTVKAAAVVTPPPAIVTAPPPVVAVPPAPANKPALVVPLPVAISTPIELAPEPAVSPVQSVIAVEPVVEPIPAVPVQEPVIIEEVAPESAVAVDPPVAVVEPVVEPIPAVPMPEPVIVGKVAPESAVAVDSPVAVVEPV
ncbi:MAG: LacI family DNA-binding transcriptional regulator, partial [bacterium]